MFQHGNCGSFDTLESPSIRIKFFPLSIVSLDVHSFFQTHKHVLLEVCSEIIGYGRLLKNSIWLETTVDNILPLSLSRCSCPTNVLLFVSVMAFITLDACVFLACCIKSWIASYCIHFVPCFLLYSFVCRHSK